MRHIVYVVVGIVLSLAVSRAAMAQVPHLIRYQGQAVASDGVPLEGLYDLLFRLYDAETVGTVVWQETQVAVQLTDGHFSVLLGQNTSLDGVDWTQARWLTIQVNAELELAPRQRITSVPAAIQAEKAESADRLTSAITPSLMSPQGAGSGLDADTVDGQHATDLLNRANHTGTQSAATITGTLAPAMINPQGSGSGLNADLLDGQTSTAFAANSHGHACTFRAGVPSGQPSSYLCSVNGEWCVTAWGGGGNSIHSCTQTNPGFGDWGAVCCR